MSALLMFKGSLWNDVGTAMDMFPLGDFWGVVCWPFKKPLFEKNDDNAGVSRAFLKLRKLWIERLSSRSSNVDLKARITRSCNIKCLFLFSLFQECSLSSLLFSKFHVFFLLVRFHYNNIKRILVSNWIF